MSVDEKSNISPFGSPDGADSDISDIMKEFVDFNRNVFSSGIATAINSRTRVIIGTKGSGKTIYLRRLREELKKEPSISIQHIKEVDNQNYVAKRDGSFHITEKVIWFTTEQDKRTVTVNWQKVWDRAILLAIASNMLGYFGDKFEALFDVDDNQKGRISKSYYKRLLDVLSDGLPEELFSLGREESLSILNFVEIILEKYSSIKKLKNYLNDAKWHEFKKALTNILSKMPPVWFFVDCVDEEYRSAPIPWMCCQQGLFYTVMEYARDNSFTNRVHIVICIRDQVMYKVKMSEHSQRYKDDLHIKFLSWNYNSIKYFFEKKIELLDDSYFCDSSNGKTIENWLGVSQIENKTHKINEKVVDYIIRHTSMIPRDIVIMGNELSKIPSTLKKSTDKNPLFEMIRDIVHSCSEDSGFEMLKFSLNHIRTNYSKAEKISTNYIHNNPKEWFEADSDELNKLKEIIRSLKTDRFSYDVLQQAMQLADSIFGTNSHVFDILWVNGAIGYIKKNIYNHTEKEVWASIENSSTTTLPLRKEQYLLRSCIVDAVGHEFIQTSKKPIIGGEVL